MQSGVAERPGRFGVPQRQIGIEADRYAALAIGEAVDRGGIARGEIEIAVERQPAGQQPFGEQQRQTGLDAGNAAQRGGEIRRVCDLPILSAK